MRKCICVISYLKLGGSSFTSICCVCESREGSQGTALDTQDWLKISTAYKNIITKNKKF